MVQPVAADTHVLPSEDICTVGRPDIQEKLFLEVIVMVIKNKLLFFFCEKAQLATCSYTTTQLPLFWLVPTVSGSGICPLICLTGPPSEMHS